MIHKLSSNHFFEGLHLCVELEVVYCKVAALKRAVIEISDLNSALRDPAKEDRQ